MHLPFIGQTMKLTFKSISVSNNVSRFEKKTLNLGTCNKEIY